MRWLRAAPILAALSVAATVGAQGRAGAPDGVRPIPLPNLENVDPRVREQVEERRAWHDRVLQSPDLPVDQRVLAHAELAALYQAYGFIEPAEAAYSNATALAPQDYRWPYYLGLLYRVANLPDKAVESYERVRALRPDDVPTLVRLAEVHLDMGRPPRAEPLLERAIELDPASAVAMAHLAQIAIARREWARAVELLERALSLQPDASSLRYPLALAYRGLGDTARAQQEADRRGEGRPTLVDPLLRKLHGLSEGLRQAEDEATAAFEKGDVEGGIAAFRRAVAEDPLYAGSRVNLALALLRGGRAGEAREELEAAARLAPDNVRVAFAMGYLLTELDDTDGAIEQYEKALARDPDHHEARFNLATLLRAEGRSADAAAQFATLIEKRPEFVPAWLGEAAALRAAGRDADARGRLEAASTRFPSDGNVAHALARLLASSVDPQVRDAARALPIAEAIHAARPTADHAETLAMALAGVARYDEAVHVQEQALAQSAGREDAAAMRERLELYRARKPYVETRLTGSEPR